MSKEISGVSKKVEEILDSALAREKLQGRSTQANRTPDDTPPGEQRVQPQSPSSPPDQTTQLRALVRVFFGFFLLAIAALVLMFGFFRHAHDAWEGTIVMLMAGVPFLGAAWHIHQGLKSLGRLADALQRDDA